MSEENYPDIFLSRGALSKDAFMEARDPDLETKTMRARSVQ